MSKKRAFVRYTKDGRVVPGSLIVTTKGGYPTGGLYQEVPVNLCCEPSGGENKIVYLPFTKSYTGTGGGCLSKGVSYNVYMTAECDADPEIGCTVLIPAQSKDTGSGVQYENAPDGDYTTTLPGNIIGYFTVVNGVITDVTAC